MRSFCYIALTLLLISCINTNTMESKMSNSETNNKEAKFISLTDWKNSILSSVENLKSEESKEFVKGNYKVSVESITSEVFDNLLDNLTIESSGSLNEIYFVFYTNEGEVSSTVLKIIAFEGEKSHSSKCVIEANEIEYDNSEDTEEVVNIDKLLNSTSNNNHITNSEALFITKCGLQPKKCNTKYIPVNPENTVLVEDIVW